MQTGSNLGMSGAAKNQLLSSLGYNTYLVATPTGEPITKFSKSVESKYNGAAMIVEEIENERRYRCNDGYPDEDFDDIVFTIQKLKTE